MRLLRTLNGEVFYGILKMGLFGTLKGKAFTESH